MTSCKTCSPNGRSTTSRRTRPIPKRIPQPLPAGLLERVAGRSPLLLCLDYDGTLAEFHPDPARAVPLPATRQALKRLARCQHVALAIITGRKVAEVRGLLRLKEGIIYAGVHGAEFADRDGKVRAVPVGAETLAQLDATRRWLTASVPEDEGFRVEDKGFSVSLHYRLADQDRAKGVCMRFRRFITGTCPALKLLRLKMVNEVVPREISKACAVTRLLHRLPSPFLPVYFGDDATDEDAFRVIRPNGIGILVGGRRQSHAQYRVSGPVQVGDELRILADAVVAITDRAESTGQSNPGRVLFNQA